VEQKKALSAFDQLSGLVMKLHQEAMRWHDEAMRKHDELKAELKADIARLEAKVDARIDTLEGKLTTKIDAVEDKLTARIDAVEGKLTARIDAVEDGLTARIDAVDTKVDHHHEDLKIDVTRIETKIGSSLEVAELRGRMDELSRRMPMALAYVPPSKEGRG